MPLSPYAPPDLSSPTYRDQLDYIVCEDGKAIGRMYDDRRTLLPRGVVCRPQSCTGGGGLYNPGWPTTR